MDDVVDMGPEEHHGAIGEVANPRNQHIEIPQIQYTDKFADESVAVQRQISPRTTEIKALEHQQDDRSGGDADKDGEAITKYSWSEGKNVVNMYLELDGLDDPCVSDHRFSRGQAADFHAHWLGARNHRRQSCPEERQTDGFPEAREEGNEKLAQVAR